MNNDKDQPASSFPNFGMPLGGDMLEKTWEMMRTTPFSAMLGAFGGPMSSVPKMVTPLTNPEELDKRIADLRAVEQWLKLNLHMLQSTIQGFEVQRATLATLQAFGAFAQSSVGGMTQPTPPAESQRAATDEAAATAAAGAAKPAAAQAEAARAAAAMAFDPADWWNLLQAQLQQIAQFADASAAPAAAAKPSSQAGAASTASDTPPAAAKKVDPSGADLRRPAPRKTAKKAVPPASKAARKI